VRALYLVADTAVLTAWCLLLAACCWTTAPARNHRVCAVMLPLLPHQFGLRAKVAVGLCHSRAPRLQGGTYPSASLRLCRLEHSSTMACLYRLRLCTITGTRWPTAVSIPQRPRHQSRRAVQSTLAAAPAAAAPPSSCAPPQPWPNQPTRTQSSSSMSR
jgi:hypothetical protein